MARLIAKPAVPDWADLDVDGTTLVLWAPDLITSVAPYDGQAKPVRAILKDALGLAFPTAGRSLSKGSVRLTWTGRNQAMLIGADAPGDMEGLAAVTDQTDAWAVFTLSGPLAEAALARIVPIDLRPGNFKRGHAARTSLQHMMSVITRTGAGTFEIMVMRAMAGTAAHDLELALKSVAAQTQPTP